jgi:site-specific recombinase XerD
VGRRGREYCCICWRKVTQAAAKAPCPRCGKLSILQPGTGACTVCSRACASCGRLVRRKDAVLCQSCTLQERRRAAQQPCPRCGRPGYLRDDSGWCGPCSHPGPPPGSPARACAGCGEVRRHFALGLGTRCYQRHPGRPAVTAANLIARLQDPPGWLGEFAAHAAAGYVPSQAVALITRLGRLLADGGSRHPQALLERSRQPGITGSAGTLARVLDDFFTARGLAMPMDHAAKLAAGRRQRLTDAVPGPLRPGAAGFCQFLLSARERARRAGTRPRADDTIERRLAVIRDMAIFLTGHGTRDWATTSVQDIEAFLATRPGSRRSRLTALRHFFTWARASRLVLTDPTRGLSARQPRGYRGPTISLDHQRQLFRRWTATDSDAHPHEALTGLLTLVHGASNAELRGLTAGDIDPAARSVRLGRRPHPVPLDPASWAAVERCLRYHRELRTVNPHLLVTRKTRATRIPASEDYARNLLRPAGVTPRLLRCTRLASLTLSTDPKLVSAAFGIHHQAATHYLAGHVDDARLHGTNPDGGGCH